MLRPRLQAHLTICSRRIPSWLVWGVWSLPWCLRGLLPRHRMPHTQRRVIVPPLSGSTEPSSSARTTQPMAPRLVPGPEPASTASQGPRARRPTVAAALPPATAVPVSAPTRNAMQVPRATQHVGGRPEQARPPRAAAHVESAEESDDSPEDDTWDNDVSKSAPCNNSGNPLPRRGRWSREEEMLLLNAFQE